jgi:hypothetical protein
LELIEASPFSMEAGVNNLMRLYETTN